MGSFSVWHWLIVLAVVLIFFGRGKIPELMGDVAKGIKNFKKGMAEDETPPPAPTAATPADPKIIDAQATPSAPAKAETKA